MPPKYNTQPVGGSAPIEQTGGPARQQENPTRCPTCGRNMQGVACVVCGELGHDWHTCRNRCLVCQQTHSGAICPKMPELYDQGPSDGEEKLQVLTRLAGEVVHLQQDITAERQRLQALKALREEPENMDSSSTPQAQGQDGPALQMLLPRDPTLQWASFFPDWRDIGDSRRRKLKKRLNQEALGTKDYDDNSPLKAKLIELSLWDSAANKPLIWATTS